MLSVRAKTLSVLHEQDQERPSHTCCPLDSNDGIIIIVTALNILGEQFVQEAEAAGFSAVSVNGENDTDDVFTVSPNILCTLLTH